MPINYVRTFRHDDWVDNVDRVQAGGDNGFNGRFHALEAEFDALTNVVTQVNAAIAQLGQQPAPQQVRTSLGPALVPIGDRGWRHLDGRAEKPGNIDQADGMMAVQLPHGARIISLRAVGRSVQAQGSNANASIRVRLRRQAIVGAAGSETIATVAVDGPNDPFDLTIGANANFERIDNDQFKYYITASVSNAGPNDPVVLTAFQVITIAA